MPNCRETITVKMALHMLKQCEDKHLDSLDSVLCDWSILDIFCGFGLYEWVQKAPGKK